MGRFVAIIVTLSALDILLFILNLGPISIRRIFVTAIGVPRFDYFHSRNRLSLLVRIQNGFRTLGSRIPVGSCP